MLLQPHHSISTSFLQNWGERAGGTSEVSRGTRSRGQRHTDTARGALSGSGSDLAVILTTHPTSLNLACPWDSNHAAKFSLSCCHPPRSMPAPTGPIFWYSSTKGLRLRAPELAGSWPSGEARSKPCCGHWRAPQTPHLPSAATAPPSRTPRPGFCFKTPQKGASSGRATRSQPESSAPNPQAHP